jgi:chromosome segregation ATPase
MATETPIPFTPEDLRKNYERIQSDLNVIQNELDQALGVWRAILATEKEEFKKVLEDREKTWDREQAQWDKDRQAYEAKIQDLETFFQQQLSNTEKNAVRALNELDSAWQQERLKWQQTVALQVKDARQQLELQGASHQQLEQRAAQLAAENARLQARAEESARLETQLGEWQSEKTVWQQAYSEREAVVQSLKQERDALETQLQDVERESSISRQELETYTDTLETQVASLQELLQQLLLPTHPLRRKNDRIWSGGESVSTLPPRAAH